MAVSTTSSTESLVGDLHSSLGSSCIHVSEYKAQGGASKFEVLMQYIRAATFQQQQQSMNTSTPTLSSSPSPSPTMLLSPTCSQMLDSSNQQMFPVYQQQPSMQKHKSSSSSSSSSSYSGSGQCYV